MNAKPQIHRLNFDNNSRLKPDGAICTNPGLKAGVNTNSALQGFSPELFKF